MELLMKSLAFDAVASSDARVLILGTLPSVRSLERREYYAHPRNSFWWIMGELIGIALWDVCRAAERAGSSDAKIRMDSIEPNDFRAFLARHPRIELICFNGQPAARLFRAIVLPLLAGLRTIPQRVLDSTSPANARLTREEKLLRWHECLRPFIKD